MKKFADINIVRQELKQFMPLDVLISLVDERYSKQYGTQIHKIEKVNDRLFKKRCDMHTHPVDSDGTVDSTASFTICPQKELWHCFGCEAHGDRFEYISQKFNLTHIESIEMCADIEGFDLSSYYVDLTIEEQAEINLFNENNTARDIAHNTLLTSNRALEYLHSRGITDESISLYNIGYAPLINNGTVSIFNNIPNKISLQLDRVDQFNDAILFPINDTYGRMRYFQSRPFNPASGMKYIGGGDTHPLYSNSDRLFGFDVAKKMLYKSGGRLVGVEGAPDTIACVQQGICACGILGTAINQDTFDILDKYRVSEFILLLDGDSAGKNKSVKNAEKYLSINTNVKLKIAFIPEDGLDPEEYINKNGVDGIIEAINNASYAIQYLIDSKWNNATTPTAKMEYMYNIQPYMISIHDKVMRQIMITHIAGKIGLDPVQIDDYYTQSAVKMAGSKLYSPDGEEILLGEAMRNGDFMSELSIRFGEDDWYLLKHKMLFKILRSSEYNDIESIFTIAKNMNVDSILTYGFIEKIYNRQGDVQFALYDVEDKLIRRKSIDIVDKFKENANDMQSDIILSVDSISTKLFNATHHRSDDGIYSSQDSVDQTMALITERMNNKSTLIGYSFGNGFSTIDTYTLGLQDKTITIIAANQSVGKTQICQNFALSQTINDNIPILWFSLEMPKELMTMRNLAILSGIDGQKIMSGNMTIEEKQNLDGCATKLRQSQFYISEIGFDLSESIAIAKNYVRTKGVKIVYVDYLQLQYVSDRRTETRSRELGTISKEWKKFAKDIGVSVVLISQLGRSALEADTAEAEHGYGSYEVAQDADYYITLKDKSEEEIEIGGIERGNKTLNISKNRYGEKTVLINIYADGPTYRMCECGIEE